MKDAEVSYPTQPGVTLRAREESSNTIGARILIIYVSGGASGVFQQARPSGAYSKPSDA